MDRGAEVSGTIANKLDYHLEFIDLYDMHLI